MGFVNRFQELTKERGTVARLSEGVPISDSLLSKYKSGKADPSLTNAVLIADFFDVSLDWLAGHPGYGPRAHRDPSQRPSPAPQLDPGESELLSDYRACTSREQTVLRATASTMADGGRAKNSGLPGAGMAG